MQKWEKNVIILGTFATFKILQFDEDVTFVRNKGSIVSNQISRRHVKYDRRSDNGTTHVTDLKEAMICC